MRILRSKLRSGHKFIVYDKLLMDSVNICLKMDQCLKVQTKTINLGDFFSSACYFSQNPNQPIIWVCQIRDRTCLFPKTFYGRSSKTP